MRMHLVLTLLLVKFSVSAQKQLLIEDADTHKPLPFSTAECFVKRWGCYADSAGRILIADSIFCNYTVTFSYVGYESKPVKANAQVHVVSLNKLPGKLEDVVTKPCKKFTEQTLEVRNQQRNFGFAYTARAGGDVFATYVANTSGKRSVILKFSYGATSGNTKAPVRLRFFQVDSSHGLPTNEITTEPIILIPQKLGWVTDDISRFNIVVPENGIVAAFEMFDAGAQYHYNTTVRMSDKSQRVMEHYGWEILGMRSSNVIGFGKRSGTYWFNWNSRIPVGSKLLPVAPQVALLIKVCNE